MDLDLDADLGQQLAHLTANVLQTVGRRYREVAALHPRSITMVAAIELVGTAPRGLLGTDLEEGVAHLDRKAHRIEDEELRFRPEIGGIGDPAGLEVGFGPPRDTARIARIRLHGRRIEDIADQHQGRCIHERIDRRRAGVGHQHHVGLVDPLPTGNRRTVEHLAFLEQRRLDDRGREGHVVLDPAHVGEAEVYVFDLMVLDELFDVFGGHGCLLG